MAFTLTQVQFEEAQRIFTETGDPVALYEYLAGFDDRHVCREGDILPKKAIL